MTVIASKCVVIVITLIHLITWPGLPLQSDSICQSETSGWIWGSFYSSTLDLENKEPNLSLSEEA